MYEKGISFVIPVYNEELNIPNVLKDLYAIINKRPDWNAEVIIIEDGSTDNTYQMILENLKKYPSAELIRHHKNQGYTQSLKDGIEKSRRTYVMYVGADE